MKYPNRLQAALLLTSRFEGLEDIARDFARIAEMKSGATFTTSEHRPGTFLRLFGGGEELMVTFEYIDGPPEPIAFAQALASPVTALLSPGMDERIALARSHILLEVSHGAMAGVEEHPNIAAMIEQLGVPQTGASASAFNHRLETLATMARIATDTVTPSVIHWTQSNQLFSPEAFEQMAAIGFPGPVGVHPLLFGEAPEIGLRTFGARHWLGREILVPATTLPWEAAYQSALDFLALAASEDGYVIPDGDTFGPEDGGEIWRVHHREAEPSEAVNDDSDAHGGPTPLYELVPLRHDEAAFVSEEYAREACVTMVRTPRDKTEPEQCGEIASHDTAADEDKDTSLLAELEAALAEGRAEAAANPPEPLPESGPETVPAVIASAAPSQPGDTNVSGRSLRARVFGNRAD